MKHLNYLFLSLLLSLTGFSYVTAQVNPSFSKDDYKKALWMTTRFYGAQRSGNGPNWMLNYHEQKGDINPTASYKGGKSFIKDADGSYDLTGGWFDCGDHVKFGQTEFYSAYMLILGYSEFPAGYDDLYSFDYNGYINSKDYTWAGKKGKPNGIPDILDEVKYATDYFMKAIRDVSTFYYEVGNGNNDHQQWVTSSYMSTLNRSQGGESDGPRDIAKATGNVTSMASFCGATLAAMARLYKPYDPAYAQACLDKALTAYQFVTTTTKGNSGAKSGSFYGAKPKYAPDMAVFFAELYRTTKDEKYLKAAEDAASFITDDKGGSWNHNYSLNYNNTEDLAFYLMFAVNSKMASQAKVRMDYYVNTLYKPTSGYILNRLSNAWGVLRYPANQAFVYALYDKMNGKEKTMNSYTLATIEYIMGKNDKNFSFITGFSSNGPQYPHHRNYYGSNANDMKNLKKQSIEFGYMVGGSLNPGSFNESLDNFQQTEGGIDYNAGLVGALGYINSILNPIIIESPHPAPNLGNDVSICGLGSVLLDSKVAAAGQRTFTWYKDDTQVTSSRTATTYTATSAGEYTCRIDSAGQWQTEGKVNVLGLLPDVNLGEDIELCNPAVVTLDAAVESSVVTYQWYKDNTIIEGADKSNYTIYRPGIYKCTVSATGCTSKSDEVTVTSRLPQVADAVSDSRGNVTMTVTGNGEYEWYATAENGTPLATGASYSTTITADKVFYVQSAGSASSTVGPKQNTAFTNKADWGIIGAKFTANKAFQITGISVLPSAIYSAGTVTLSFELKKEGAGSGKTYASAPITVTASQNPTNLIVLTFPQPIEITETGNYTLSPVSANPFSPVFYQNGPAYSTYSSDVITFTGATNGTASNNPFPALFNWQIQSGSGCARTMVKATYSLLTGTEITMASNGCEVYPNPVGDILYINFMAEQSEQIKVEIISFTGSLLKSRTVNSEELKSGINVSELQQGLYLIKIISGNTSVVKQIIKK